ncbi:phenylalanine--tRNA ligase subunit alpha [PVC group bacterium (ex Bugula neritina AB1)]|nr:phenylalanine--tRNA ligase subunit alpha [PVC group bacterium (ex Bugula neritina AB1)]
MLDELEKIKKLALEELQSVTNSDEAESFRIKYLGKKGVLTKHLKNLSQVPPESRPAFGRLGNELKQSLNKAISIYSKSSSVKKNTKLEDFTLPGESLKPPRRHPIRTIMSQCLDVFKSMGFESKTGPDIETDFYNFQALGIPADHPAKDMHDTFYLNPKGLLRTHTSPVQIRTMEKSSPPIRIIAPGKVYRRDSDVTHLPMFHQIEGLLVDKDISFADLKGVLEMFLHGVFGSNVKVRFRPSYFPFTEPSAEVDISCMNCDGNNKDCRVCSNTGWLEIAGAGMVDPEVFRSVNYDSDEWTGFAFGLGIERIAMLIYGVTDIRLFYENDLYFLENF